MDSSQQIEKVTQAIKNAGTIALKHFNSNLNVAYKSDNSPVSEADIAVHTVLTQFLRKEFPDSQIVSEEDSQNSESKSDWCWFLDPIDGTADFIKKASDWTISLGLTNKGHAHLGFIYQPVTGNLYIGGPSIGSQMHSPASPFKKLKAETKSQDLIRLVCSKSHFTKEVEACVQKIPNCSIHNVGSVALKMALVCNNEFDIYFCHKGHYSTWDICAGHAIGLGAGMKLSIGGNDNFNYLRKNPRIEETLLFGKSSAIAKVLNYL